MDKQIAFAFVNPYTLAKSRTGGIIGRFIGRTDLNLVGARMFTPSKELATRYAELVEKADPKDKETGALLASYIRKSYIPNAKTGLAKRVLMLIFEGENAVEKIWKVTGSATARQGTGETIRDTYGDYVTDDSGKVSYFEPAVLVAPTPKRVVSTLKLWSEFARADGGIVENADDVASGATVQKTLVLLKPDNFRTRSGRPGSIIDVLSTSGLRIVGAKKFMMTVAQAEEFYGPVEQVLRNKFQKIAGKRVAAALNRELECEIPPSALEAISPTLAPLFANAQFESIVKFMTGLRPSECTPERKRQPGTEHCLALVYQGEDAVARIRAILGATDPNEAQPGSIRREFGSNIMVNAAHASDSPESVKRELGIIKVEEDTVTPLYEQYRDSMSK